MQKAKKSCLENLKYFGESLQPLFTILGIIGACYGVFWGADSVKNEIGIKLTIIDKQQEKINEQKIEIDSNKKVIELFKNDLINKQNIEYKKKLIEEYLNQNQNEGRIKIFNQLK